MDYIKKHIVSGAPGTGKSTLIRELEKEYLCIHEVSRQIIINEQKAENDGMPWDNLERFVTLVYKASVNELANCISAHFIDRSILDLTAYLEVEGKEVPYFLEEFPYKKYFKEVVFFAPTWSEIYHKDAQRIQSFEYCQELEKVLFKTYKNHEFEIIKLPKDTVTERVQFINNHLR